MRSIAAATFAFLVGCLSLSPSPEVTAAEPAFRPPAVPLVACDPYFSIWSQADQLTETATTHWTGKPHRMTALLRVDDQTYRLMGSSPASLPAMSQSALQVLPTRTIYRMEGGGVEATLTFLTPALPADVAILSRPTTYLTCQVRSLNSREHEVAFYFDAAGELATNTPDQQVSGSQQTFANADALKVGTMSQRILGKKGDDLRIDWGYFYLAAPKEHESQLQFGRPAELQQRFAEGNRTDADKAELSFPTAAGDVAASVRIPFGQVGHQPLSRYLVLAYDDLYSIEYMSKKLRPYWRRDGWEANDLITAAVKEYETLTARCEQFDDQLMADLREQGGDQYARIAALAYRQCFAAGKFVADANGQPLQFSKENHSNGCIATSDVFYPMAPQFLLFGPTLAKAVLVPFMEYAASERWQFPFAPHDLGTYPKANGQVYGGGERSAQNQMPVEESGNMLILFAALAKLEGNADFAALYWDELSRWAEYLQNEGFDPDNQLCTDDFAGHMAHNVNLSAKAICGLGSYAMLCSMRGKEEEAARYREIAERFASQWVAAAKSDDHFRLAFDREETWSQKYNLVWDRILGLNLFPESVFETEMAYYRKVQNEYGLPLDNRSDYTKLDWILWSATLTEDRQDFEALVAPVYRFLQETPDRSPMTDWYFTSTAKKRGFTARPVVGGVFLKMLYDKSVWSRYAASDETRASGWAPMPVPPTLKTLVPTSREAEVDWRYTTDAPPAGWPTAEFSDDRWQEGRGGFGTAGTPGAEIGTRWNSDDIWLRRSFTLSETLPPTVGLQIHHDEDATVYLNGKKVVELGGWSTDYEVVEIPTRFLRQGDNVLAIHCHQTGGGQFIDCGLVAIIPADAASSQR